ncbi:MAG: carotenoid oxygenase family protein [Nevskiaceae bacterium]|jgi:carotenoid cleavage dioxygenase|nr:carotenoid oxygenase family protein [Nevskiaceae bacterium]
MAENSNDGLMRTLSAATRFESQVLDCDVIGKIPADINGAFYRVGAEWFYPPKFADDAILNADGYVSSFRIRNGRVDYTGRWVRTQRFDRNREAGRQLFGYYRNPFTDDPAISDPQHPNTRTVSNTAPLVHHGKLYTLKEDGLPYLIDPLTLETQGTWDAFGTWKSETFSAHPKLDPLTGEMVSYGYEANGLASDDLYIATLNSQGRVSDSVTVKVPYVSVIHDMALTHRHVVIPFGGYVTGMERLREGKIHWGWDKTKPSVIGVIPRGGSARDMRWFEGPERCMMHTFNAVTEGDKVILYAPFFDSNFFPFFPNVDGAPFNPAGARAFIRKITLDLGKRGNNWQEEILWPMQVGDLGKVDPRVLSLPTRYLYTQFYDETKPIDRAIVGSAGPARPSNCYGRFDLETGQLDTYFAGPTHVLQECSFVPRPSGQEGDGYLVGVATNYAEDRAELVIADAQRLGEGDVARVILPFKISQQVHGVWADARELGLG